MLVNVTVLASESFVTVRCVFLISTDAVLPSLSVMVSVDTSLDFDVKVADFRALWVALMVKVLERPSLLVSVSTFTFVPAFILMASLAWVLMASLDTLKVMAPLSPTEAVVFVPLPKTRPSLSATLFFWPSAP